MFIHVNDIYDSGVVLDFESKTEEFPMLLEMMNKGDCEFISPVVSHLEVTQASGLINVQGSIVISALLVCSRCLKEYETLLTSTFDLTFTNERPKSEQVANDEGVELSEQEIQTVYFQGEEIDLRESIQEQVALAMPFRPLCCEDCNGLCSQCGVDLNTGSCECKQNRVDARFAALKNIKIDNH